MRVFRVNSSTLASSNDAVAKIYRSDKGRLRTSNTLPSHDVRRIAVRAFDGHGKTVHKCWDNFDIKELPNGPELSETVCTKSHQSVKLREQVLRQLNQIYRANSGSAVGNPRLRRGHQPAQAQVSQRKAKAILPGVRKQVVHSLYSRKASRLCH